MKWNDSGRVCSVCGTFKGWDEFSEKGSKRYRNKPEVKTHQIKQPKCKCCANAEVSKWREAQSPERLKDLYLRRTYGITYSDYVRRLEDQEFSCGICYRELNTSLTMETLSPNTAVVDHCHATGRVRGILCNECNRGLGYFRDNAAALATAVKYLENS